MTALLVAEAADLPLDVTTWQKQQHVWWVWDRPSYGVDRLEWRDWTFSLVEPPLSMGQVSNRCGWRHPTFEEACERQARFAEMPRARWEDVVGPGSAPNLRRIAPRSGRSLLVTSGGREYEAEQRLAARAGGGRADD